jgi:hypothetical protein
MKASEIILPVLSSLHESTTAPVRWTFEDLYEFLTDAMYQIVLLRPDANSDVESVLLTANSTKQHLPDGGTQLLGVVRNTGADGNTPGQVITLVERHALDAANISWHTAQGESVIDHYAYNEKVPLVYWVSPVPAEGVYIEIEYAKTPTEITSLDDDLDLNPIWKNPLMNFVKHRCYAINNSSQHDMIRSNELLSQFYVGLGEEAKARLVFTPNAEQGGAS